MCHNQRITIFIVMFFFHFFAQPLLSQYAGGTGTADDPFIIETAEQMNTIGLNREHWDKNFKLIADIDMSNYSGEQYNIIGSLAKDNTAYFPFLGVFDGNGHSIINFTYSSTQENVNDVGIFGQVGSGSIICNLTLVDPNIDVRSPAGGLVGIFAEGHINNCSVQGGSISGATSVGGLVGNCWVESGESKITNCYTAANVSGDEWVGGLVGANFGLIKECFSTGNVSGSADIGGLVGWNGRLPSWPGRGNIQNSYANGNVSGNNNIGGLVGSGSSNTTITKCYATGIVSGNINVGGLIGQNSGSVIKSFWDINSSGLVNSDAGIGKTTLDMQSRITFTSSGWDFLKIWTIAEGKGYPKLLWKSEQTLTQSAVDLNGDRIIDFCDFALIAENWLKIYPVTHWKLDETEGVIASDCVGDNHGTVHGNVLWQPHGAVNGALQLHGTDEYVSTGFILNPAEGPMSIFIWIKGGLPGQVIVSQASGINWLMADSLEGSLMTMLCGSGRSGNPLMSQAVITDGTWHRIGLVWDGSYRFLYIDGIEAASDSNGLENVIGSDGALLLGAGKDMEPGSFWSGLVDDMQIFDRAVAP